MNEAVVLILAGTAGILLGGVFFGGLWWTVRRGLASQHAALWFFGSLLLRTGIVLVGFYLVSSDRWERLVACLLGFVLARFIVIRFCGPPLKAGDPSVEEAGHAPKS